MAAPRLCETFLVADCRERAVVPFLDAHLAPGGGGAEFSHVVRQITTGDFHICRRGAVLACLERKTLADFAASLKDGRYANVEKMRALRRETGCLLFFLVEGPAFPALSSRFARVPFQSINTAMTNLMVRDGIFVVLTKDEDHTARRLAELLRSFDEAPPAPGGGEGPGGGWGAGAGEGGPAGAGGPDVEVPAALTRPCGPPGPAQAAVDVWAQLPGVSLVLGKRLSALFSAADLAAGRVGAEGLRRVRTVHGRALPRPALASLAAVAAGELHHAAVLLSGVKGVSRAAAVGLLAQAGGLAPLCALTPEALGDLRISSASGRSARFGAAKAGRLLAALLFVEPPGAPPGGTPPARAAEAPPGSPSSEDEAAREDAGGAERAEDPAAEAEALAAADALLREILLGEPPAP